ncbi:hypothetical protein SJAG_04992 [Schizosaccharomyces japonicus yFS275]|uniref:Ribosome-assembly protein 3 C-terminal domain-containing protein n=1 Tax=Schizosaccharomyces japonicus (strain yFS275 / FY16936) TaxID=402676 RepID=B6K8B5_SCHJY|nr:hypothetical protein SJAG_04992 [Schizosaccharomyces japonicus yFS275]EEB09769.1 hypothetical protein SJAG_04992 [Schizosaccharomyces japonicus yFS275]
MSTEENDSRMDVEANEFIDNDNAETERDVPEKSKLDSLRRNPTDQKPSLAEYMDQLTKDYAEELDELRQREIFDDSKLQMLIRSLRAGHKIFE